MIFQRLQALFKKEIEFLSLEINLLLNCPRVLLIFLLMVGNLSGPLHKDFSFDGALQRIMSFQSVIQVNKRLLKHLLVYLL